MQRRRFNTTGPCVETLHYLIDPLSRLPEAPGFIEQGAYFVVHAPRQTGKTTTILALARELTCQGQYAAVYASCQVAADTEDVGQAIGALIHRLGADARQQLPPELHPPARAEAPPIVALMDFLGAWSRACARPVVLLLDEIDALKGAPLLSVLHQLRDGFHHDRPKAFPWSVILCGQQDVTSDRVASSQGRPVSSIPFNIKIASLRLGDFDPHQTDTLLDQHTADTGQAFTPEARAQIFTYTQGQPWLTNALANEIIEEMAVTGPITAEHVERAKENLILARATHLDSLAHKLQEPRVRRILTPLLAGDIVPYDETFDDDLTYVRDLGLVTPRLPLQAANPIYREVITRVLGQNIEASLTLPPKPSYVRSDGSLDIDRLLTEFLAFWKRHGEALGRRETYHEIAAQLVLMAWLQRVVNGGGYVEREYAIGKGAIDLQIRWPLPGGGWQQEAFELKTRGPHDGDPLEEGLEQLDRYLDQLGLETGTLVVFDRRPDALPIAQRSWLGEATTPAGRGVRLLRG